MTGVLILALVFGVLAVLISFSRWLAHRHWAAAGNLLIAVVLFVLVRVFWPAADNLATYRSMPDEGPIAQLTCERTGPESYRVTLTRLPDGHMQVFEMRGDEWRLDIRTLAWRDQAARLGLRSGYKLDRLGARFTGALPDGLAATASTTRTAATNPGAITKSGGTASSGATGQPSITVDPLPSSYPLGDRYGVGEDVWAQARTGTWWERYADARHAYGPWRPFADGGRFDVWMRRGGPDGGAELEARPANEAAAKAVQVRNRPVVATR